MTQLHVLQDEVQACRRCAHGSTRIQIVFAKGDAAQTLLGVSIQITALRVRMHRSQSGGFNFLRMVQQPQRSAKIITTYHPAYLLRQPNNKELSRAVWADLKRAVEALR